MIKGLGNKILATFGALVRFFWSTATDVIIDEVPEAFAAAWNRIADEVRGQVGIDEIARGMRDNPEVALSASLAAAGVAVAASGPMAGLAAATVVGSLAGQAMQLTLELALADVRAETEVKAQLPFIPIQTEAQIKASLPFIPTQVDAQMAAQLNWIPQQTEAQIKASLPFIPMQTEAQVMAQLPFIPLQVEAQTKAQVQWMSLLLRGQIDANKDVRPQGVQPQQAGQLVARGFIEPDKAIEQMAKAGFEDELLVPFGEMGKSWPTPQQLVQAYWRRIIDKDTYLAIMQKNGYEETEAERVLAVSYYYPPPTDLITWVAREVFEPDSIAKYGLEDELELVDPEPFQKGGMTDEQLRNYWIAHWQHPAFDQIATMLVRDILIDPADRQAFPPGSPEWRARREQAEAEVYEWYRLVEIAPHWRNALTKMVYSPYTRVDVRRAFEMHVVSETELLRNYLDLGYDEEHARTLTLWTKIDRTLPGIIARYKNGWIGEDEVLKEILDLGVSAEHAQELFEKKIKAPEKPNRTVKERDLTKAEIIRGVKRQIITEDQARQYFMRMGYDASESEYILRVNLEAGSSPETPEEFEHWVELDRAATGRDASLLSAAVLTYSKEVRQQQLKIADLEKKHSPLSLVDAAKAELARLEYLLTEAKMRR